MNEITIPRNLQIFSGLVLLAFVLWVLFLLRHHRLSLRDSLVWLLSSLGALTVVIFPRTLLWAARGLGVEVASNALFAIAFVYVLLNQLALTIAMSRAAVNIRRLAQETALLRAELERRVPANPTAIPDRR